MVKMIATWGSQCSGKKTLAAAMAAHLAAMKRNTVIISTDASTPALPVFLPLAQISSDASLGTLLTRPLHDYQSLKGFIHIHPNNDRFGYMGFASGEMPLTHKTFTRDHMVSLLRVLNGSPFDYVIFVCQTNPVFDPMSQLALQTSEHCIRLITPDVRGIEFEKAHRNWLSNVNGVNFDAQIRILSPVRDKTPVDDVVAVSGSAAYLLPWSEDVYNKSGSGAPIIGCGDRYGIQFDKRVKQLVERMVANDERGSSGEDKGIHANAG